MYCCVFCFRFEGQCECTHTIFSVHKNLSSGVKKALLPTIIRFSTISETDEPFCLLWVKSVQNMIILLPFGKLFITQTFAEIKPSICGSNVIDLTLTLNDVHFNTYTRCLIVFGVVGLHLLSWLIYLCLCITLN